ncbi:DUF2147 domain-containing protein [Solitalea canadensis]|uniref:DUF2147 domain-containing protein n=1 Tax=Solitalea canadensis (strain ATCC 29591 / DSM 3403 / JCM 21819 / LMG 8368 / NBRC 15130 / NCIMB 12057 / USAM 9D) TaxID=929556 RepID=H8KUX8_SOLCM|nr:DUF2147 domain-containing protein [Solitalea canadensis]AFD07678.1 hypothetical protein Solca_2644 [Solitalea canadensis DSM 3403]
MKKILLLILVCLTIDINAQSLIDDTITGTWLTADQSGQIVIYRRGNKYYGSIKGGTGKEQYDINNPEPIRRKNSLIGLIILKEFKFDGENQWKGGMVYDPNNGKTYNCILSLTDKKTLKLRGYIGFSWLGRTEIWTRIN